MQTEGVLTTLNDDGDIGARNFGVGVCVTSDINFGSANDGACDSPTPDKLVGCAL